MDATCSDAGRMLLAGAAFLFATGMRFAFLRWRELREAEIRVRDAVRRVEISTARIDATAGLVSRNRADGDPPRRS